MKKTLLILAIFFFAYSIYSQVPTIKFYLNDGTFKTYNINDIENLGFKLFTNNTIMKIYFQKNQTFYYPTLSIDTLKFETDTSNAKVLSVYIFGKPRAINLKDIDSICFAHLETKISDKAIYLDSLNSSGEFRIDSNTIILKKSNSNLGLLKDGDFIVNGLSKETPYGLMKRVISINTSGDSVIIFTEDANITDIVENCIIYINKKLSPDDTVKSNFQKGITLDKPLFKETFSFSIDDFSIYKKPPFEVTFNGKISLNMDYGFAMVISNWRIQQVVFQSTSNLILDLNVNATLTGKLNKETPFFHAIFAAIPTPIPFVFVTPTLDLLAKLELELKGGLEIGYSPNIEIVSGFEYNNGNIRPIIDFKSDFSPTIPKLIAEGSIKPSFGPQINTNINDIKDALNAFVNVMPYCKLEADLIKWPCWEFLGGLESKAGLSSKWLGKYYDIPLIVDLHKVLLVADPKISSINENPAKIDDLVTIKGDCFGDSHSATCFVLFNDIVATQIDSWSNSEIIVKVPQNATSGMVSVTLNGSVINGKVICGSKSNEYDFTVYTPSTLKIASVTPTSGNIGDFVMITGTGFGKDAGTNYVTFNGTQSLYFTSWSDKLIKVKVPTGATSGKLSVNVNGEKSNEVDFTINPNIKELSSDKFVIGEKITIKGSGFASVQDKGYVSFNGTKAITIDSWNDTEIEVKVPPGTTTGKVIVNQSGNNSNEYPYTILPLIDGIKPITAKIGNEITITGSGFGNTQSNSFVTVGNKNATTYNNWTGTEIKVIIPNGVTSFKVSVTVAGNKSNEIDFKVIPDITNISPTSVRIGDEITITGTGFGDAKGSSEVLFNTTLAVDFTNWADEEIIVKVPAGATSGKISVSVNNQKSDEKDFVVLPFISGINPTSAQIGADVTIRGTGFGDTRGTSVVSFNSINATDYTWSSTSIVVKVPTGATTGKLSITVGGNISNELDFTVSTSDTYETVTIGTQVWMLKNLDVSTYRNGDSIPHRSDFYSWVNYRSGGWCYYENDSANGSIFGKLYNWYAINDSRGLAPIGWHIPSDEEFKILEVYLGMTESQTDSTEYRGTNEGGKLKETGTSFWLSPNTGATNESRFSALPGGYRNASAQFYGIGAYGAWWSSTEYDSLGAWIRSMDSSNALIYRYFLIKQFGYSVRCVRD